MDDDLISRKKLRKAFKESGYFTGPWLHWARLLIDIAPTVDVKTQYCGDDMRGSKK